jgi:predicted enzyme involved in methoxymalonyl-ACP biosynthesis
VRSGFGRCYRLTDRFGDNSIISLAAVARDADADARIDLLLMSCRVLGRKVEEVILADIATRAHARSARDGSSASQPDGEERAGLRSLSPPRL